MRKVFQLLLTFVSFISFSAVASTDSIVVICKESPDCLMQTKIQQHVIAVAGGEEKDVILVNDHLGVTSLFHVRHHDFGGAEFPNMIAITAQEIVQDTGVAHTNSLSLAKFIKNPIKETLQETSAVLDNISGRPTYPMVHFIPGYHELNVSGYSLLTLRNQLESALNQAYETRVSNDLADVEGTVNGNIAVTFRNILAVNVGGSLSSVDGTTGDVLFKANTTLSQAPWGLKVSIVKNPLGGLITTITSVVLIQNSQIIFELPVSANGTVNLAELLGTTFFIQTNSNIGSLRQWFAAIGTGVSLDPCSNGKCKVTVTDISPE